MKKWYTSKTMIVNLLTLAVGVGAIFQGTDWIMDNPEAASVVVAIIGGVNVLLRLFTDKGIK